MDLRLVQQTGIFWLGGTHRIPGIGRDLLRPSRATPLQTSRDILNQIRLLRGPSNSPLGIVSILHHFIMTQKPRFNENRVILSPCGQKDSLQKTKKKTNTNEHCQSSICRCQTAGNSKRGKNIFISAQGILTLKLQTHCGFHLNHWYFRAGCSTSNIYLFYTSV